jgi:hypothetical protein
MSWIKRLVEQYRRARPAWSPDRLAAAVVQAMGQSR